MDGAWAAEAELEAIKALPAVLLGRAFARVAGDGKDRHTTFLWTFYAGSSMEGGK